MNYRKLYFKIIKHAISENRKKKQGIYYELHHILPKSLFPNWKNRKSNQVLLTAREHFFCHQLLDKIYPYSRMFCALWFLANDGRHTISSKEYERLRIRFSEFNSNLHKGNKYSLGRKITEEERKRRCKSMAGKNKGKKYYTNGEIETLTYKQPVGFWRGRCDKSIKKIKENNPPPWNKGTILTNEITRQKLIMSHLGKKDSEETKKKKSDSAKGKNTWTLGRKWYTNGIESKQLEKCPNGWYLGRHFSTSKYKKENK